MLLDSDTQLNQRSYYEASVQRGKFWLRWSPT